MAHEQSIAVVGASETTLWTYWLMRNLDEYKFPGEVWPVNPNRESVYGVTCYPDISALPRAPETAVLITNADRAVTGCRELVRRGTPRIVVVSDGFREAATEEGLARENALRELVDGTDIQLVGPNCVGLASFHESFCAIAEPTPPGIEAGEVSVISQSGVLTYTALAALKDEGLGIDVCYSLGNGATFDVARALRSIADRPTTKTICAVVESIRDRDELAEAVRGGRAAGVEFLFLLLGQSEDGKRVAQSHTGAVVGDQRIMRAWLKSLGVVLVDSFEELARSAALSGVVGRPGPGRGVFILTNSGGGAGLAADTSARCGLPLAQLSEATKAELKKHVLSGTTIGNPLDVTSHGGPASTRAIYDLVTADPDVGILLDPYGMSWPDDSDERRWHRASFSTMVTAAAEAEVPLIITSLVGQRRTEFVQRAADGNSVAVNNGLAVTLSSLAKLYVDDGPGAVRGGGSGASARTDSVVDEVRARAILSAAGFPVVNGVHAATPGEAAQSCLGLRTPWVAKLSLEGLGHKGRVGGVRLGLSTALEVERVCREITESVTALELASAADVSFMIQEMEFGPELLIGAVRDRVAGPSVIVGVGGWAAEAATLFAAIPLPADREVFTRDLGRSVLPRLIGDEKVEDLVALLVDLSAEFTEGALSGYSVVECNPVIISPTGPRIADALLINNA